jgi:surface protein
MWDTRSVATMHAMFSDALAFNQDISNWNVSNVDDMSAMFSITYSFNQPLTTQQVTVGASTYTAWDVSNVNNMNAMFANSVFNQDITSWSVDNVTDCKDFSVASPLTGANTPNFSCPL